MGFHNVESILANIENKDKSKLLEIEQNIIKGLDEIRKINNVLYSYEVISYQNLMNF